MNKERSFSNSDLSEKSIDPKAISRKVLKEEAAEINKQMKSESRFKKLKLLLRPSSS
jgi:hypothetical protein